MKLPALRLIQNGTIAALAGASVYLGIELSALNSKVQEHPSIEQLNSVQSHIDQVDSQLDDLRKTSIASVEDWQESDQEIRDMLGELRREAEQPSDIEALQLELTQLSATMQSVQAQMQDLRAVVNNRLATATAPPADRTSPPSRKEPRAAKNIFPPFNTFAVESRGGEFFLAVSPIGATQLENVELLRPYRSYMGWKLDALDPGEARFERPDGSPFTARIRR